MAESTQTATKPPFCSFSTFKTFIESLAETAVPPHIDRSVMGKLSGVSQGQLISAMQFLGLIDAGGTAQPRLHTVVASYATEGWGEVIGDLISDSYCELLGDLDVDSASGKALKDRFKSAAGVDGQVLAKTLRFYLRGLDEAGLTYSPHFKDATKGLTAGRSSTKKGQRNKSRNSRDATVPDGPPEDKSQSQRNETKLRRIPILIPGKPGGELVIPEDLTEKEMAAVDAAVAQAKVFATLSTPSDG